MGILTISYSYFFWIRSIDRCLNWPYKTFISWDMVHWRVCYWFVHIEAQIEFFKSLELIEFYLSSNLEIEVETFLKMFDWSVWSNYCNSGLESTESSNSETPRPRLSEFISWDMVHWRVLVVDYMGCIVKKKIKIFNLFLLLG